MSGDRTYEVAGDTDGRPASGVCDHLDHIRDVQPAPPRACEDCLKEGTRWVHLRLCLECGHVGCCDNSPRRHATAHWRSTSHPIIASHEPGESSAWCYPDELVLAPAEAS